MKMNKLSGRTWFNLILFGLIGQVAWAVENMYFNTFLYNSVYSGANQTAINGSMNVMDAISLMVAFSAVTAFVSTLIFGTLSDRLNRRKIFMSIGYIVWGIITASFGFISRKNTAVLLGSDNSVLILTVTIWIVIIMDSVMTLTGSMGNDAGFNAWVTDITDKTNRPVTETVLAVLPVAATGIVLALGLLVKSVGYSAFFFLLGGTVILCGILGFATINESRSGIKEDTNYFSDLIYGFRPSVIKENRQLYLVLTGALIFNIAIQIFFPYVLIYLQHVIIPASGSVTSAKVIASAVFAFLFVVVGILLVVRFSEKLGRIKIFLIATASLFIGLFSLYLVKSLSAVLLGVAPTALGYAALLIFFNATMRDYTPEDKAGLFQGVRMIFYVLVPMVFGPLIGSKVIQNSPQSYVNEYGVTMQLPTSAIFLWSAVISLTVLVPVIFLRRIYKTEKRPCKHGNKADPAKTDTLPTG